MNKTFDKKLMSLSDFLKSINDASTPHTEGNYKNKDAKGSDRNPKDIIMEMTSVKHATYAEAKNRLLKDGYTPEDIDNMSHEEMLTKAKCSDSVVESLLTEMTSPKGAIAAEAANRLRKSGMTDEEIEKLSYEERVSRAKEIGPIDESLSNEGISKIKDSVEKNGTRKTALSMVNAFLNKHAGMSTNLLPDTATLADGLDDIEELLNQTEYNEAWDAANNTALAMLEDEGFGDNIFECKAKFEKELEDLKIALKDKKISSNDYQTAYHKISKKIKMLTENKGEDIILSAPAIGTYQGKDSERSYRFVLVVNSEEPFKSNLRVEQELNGHKWGSTPSGWYIGTLLGKEGFHGHQDGVRVKNDEIMLDGGQRWGVKGLQKALDEVESILNIKNNE